MQSAWRQRNEGGPQHDPGRPPMIVRRQHNSGYQVMPNRVFNDESLSLDARGLMGYLLSKPDHWRANIEDIQKRCGIGRDKAYRLIRDLIAAGYIERRETRDESGRIISHDYVIFDCPSGTTPLPENPEVDTEIQDEPLPDLPDTANQHAYKRTDSEQLLNLPKEDAPARATRLPSDWQPSEADIAFAIAQGLDPPEARDQAERFRDYWHAAPGAKGRKADWPATWRNWIRKAKEYRHGRSSGAQNGTGSGGRRGRSPQDKLVEAFLAEGAAQRGRSHGVP